MVIYAADSAWHFFVENSSRHFSGSVPHAKLRIVVCRLEDCGGLHIHQIERPTANETANILWQLVQVQNADPRPVAFGGDFAKRLRKVSRRSDIFEGRHGPNPPVNTRREPAEQRRWQVAWNDKQS